MRLQQLRAAQASKLAEADTLSAAAKDRAFTIEERAAFDTLMADSDAIGTDISREEKLQASRTSAPDANQVTQRDAEKAAGLGRVEVGQDRTVLDPKKGFATHREFLSTIMDAGRGRREDARLKPLKQRATVGSDEAGNYSDPVGGFLVPEGFSPSLMQLRPEDDPFGGKTQNVPMQSSVLNIPARTDKDHTTSVSGGLTVTRRPETVAASSSRMAFEQVTMRATSLFGLSYATEEILTDSPISFIALISNGFSQEFASKLVDERINGSGVGEFEGVMNSPALVSVSKEAGQSADTINYENVKKMRARSWGYGSAFWLANHDTLPELMSLVQIVGTGGSAVYQPSAREDAPDRLLGRPIFYTEYTKTLGDAGDILLINPTQYLEGVYQPLQSAESMHVRFVEHERAFKFWLRNDGRGWWRAALTPKNSTATLSPFVRLSARA